MKEVDIERRLVQRVKAAGGVAYKFSSPATRGVSDRLVCWPDGTVWFVELKAPGGRLSPLQVDFGLKMAAMKQKYVVLWSYEDVEAFVARLSAGSGHVRLREEPLDDPRPRRRR